MSPDDLPAPDDLPGPTVEATVPITLSHAFETVDGSIPEYDSLQKLHQEMQELVDKVSSRFEELAEVWMQLRFRQADKVELRVATNPGGDWFPFPIVDGEYLRLRGVIDFKSMVQELVASDEYWTGHPIELVVDYLSPVEVTRAAAWLSRHAVDRNGDALDRAARIMINNLALRLADGRTALRWLDGVSGEGNAGEEGFVDDVVLLWRRGWLDDHVGTLLTHEDDRVRERAMHRIAPYLDNRAPMPSDAPRSSPPLDR